MNDLIILTSDRTAPVQAALHLGLRPVVVAAKRYGYLYELVAPTKTVQNANAVDAVLEVIREVISESGPVPILAATEKTIPIAGIARTVLGLPGMSAETAVAFTNKSAMKSRWEATGVRAAPSRRAFSVVQLRARAQELGLPVVVKPSFGAGGIGTTVVNDISDIAEDDIAVAARRTGLTVESLLPVGTEYHVDSVVREGEVVAAWVSAYFFPLGGADHRTTAGSYLLQDGEVEYIHNFNERAVKAMGVRDGVTHFECFDVEGEMFAGEIACRPAGGGVSDVLKRARGVDLWEEFVRAGVGMELTSMPSREMDTTQGWMYFPRFPEFSGATGRHSGIVSVREDAPGSATHVLNLEADTVHDMVMLRGRISEEA